MFGRSHSDSQLLTPWQRLLPAPGYLHPCTLGMRIDKPACVHPAAPVYNLEHITLNHA